MNIKKNNSIKMVCRIRVLKKWNTNLRETLKYFNILRHQENVNKNYFEIWSYPSQNG